MVVRRFIRGNFMTIKEKAHTLKLKISALYLAIKRKDTPFYAKIMAGITVAYALSPIDLIPDFIPILGYLDDIILLPFFIFLSVKLIPHEIMEQCEEQAKGMWQRGKPKKWYYAIPIIFLWVIVVAIIVKAILDQCGLLS